MSDILVKSEENIVIDEEIPENITLEDAFSAFRRPKPDLVTAVVQARDSLLLNSDNNIKTPDEFIQPHDPQRDNVPTVTISTDFLAKLKADNELMAKVLKVYAEDKNWKKIWSIGDGKYVTTFRYHSGAIPAKDVMEAISQDKQAAQDSFGEDSLD